MFKLIDNSLLAHSEGFSNDSLFHLENRVDFQKLDTVLEHDILMIMWLVLCILIHPRVHVIDLVDGL